MTEVIAEIGQAHDGSVGLLHSYIDALAGTGVDTVKFQAHFADAESSPAEPFRVRFSRVDATRQDYWRRMELSTAQWREVQQHCADRGLRFLCTPFSNHAVEVLESLGVERYKIGSGDIGNHLLLNRVARTGKPTLISSGMSAWDELDAAVDIFRAAGSEATLMQCNSAYPTPPEHVGLNVIAEMRARYALPVGLSDHSGTPYASLAAVALGASVLEIHAVFDRRMFGPDATSSLTIDELAGLVRGVRFLDCALAHPVDKADVGRFAQMRAIFGKSLAVNKALPAGHVLTLDDLEAKKPYGQGLSAAECTRVLGRRLRAAVAKWDFLTEAHLDDAEGPA